MSLRSAWWWSALLLLLLPLSLPARAVVLADPLVLERAEAARADWDEWRPPDEGWVPVTLLDTWDKRWPRHNGVVWYRLHWDQERIDQPVALLIHYVCMSAAIHVNGHLLARDRNLVEPLSRAWTAPHYQLIPAALLKPGQNTLLVRVSGLAAYQPGFGTVEIGDPGELRVRYRQGYFARYQIKWINLAMSAVLGVLFLMIWLLRRQDTVYGWFALLELAGALYAANYVAADPWPFNSTDGWQAFIMAMYLVAGASYVMFLLRYAGRSFPRVEAGMGVACVATLLLALLAPGWMGPHRLPWVAVGTLFFFGGMGFFLVHAWRSRRVDELVLAVCLLLPLLVSLHDLALFMGWVNGHTYLLSLTSVLTLMGIGFVLSYRFVTAMRQVEGFNHELKQEVEAATRQLSDTLSRQHALALANGRAHERLQLVRDLHDGFGGTLVGAIAQLEHAPAAAATSHVIGVLKEVRDDLRLVIDSTAREQSELLAQIAPLRHRLGGLLESAGIACDWRLEGMADVVLEASRSLDVLRLLQEALTNVFKHSHAQRAWVVLERRQDRLWLCIEDDGRGIDGSGPSWKDGTGLESMRMRGARLGGVLDIETGKKGTRIRLDFPIHG